VRLVNDEQATDAVSLPQGGEPGVRPDHDQEDHAAPSGGEIDAAHDTHAPPGSGSHGHDYLSRSELLHHVQDDTGFHVPRFLGERWEIPDFLGVGHSTLVSVGTTPIVKGRLTKFMLLELIAALIIIVVFVGYARRIKSGQRVSGRFWNLIEVFVVFVRNEMARPAIGKHDAERFLPFIWTLFFFILVLNLLGMIPWLGSATGAFAVTAMLALITFVVVLGAGMKRMGVMGFWTAQVPHMDLPKPLAILLVPMIWLIEVFGFLVKHFVLAVRLFANMFAGHLVLSVFLAFIGAAGASLYYLVAPAAVAGSVAFSLLELFVAFLQAYVFAFLASLFIGAAIHPH
jgi:F-type H+-transporting ATPase subunit a